ncbi:MAG: cbb3-type cytochrome oxidase assembly protein CcoS [Candidatus Cyclobacteriaceae bacterium M2_1C_046]
MEVIFILIGLSFLVASGFLGAYIWAYRSGQYDDDYTPSVRILMDDELKSVNKNVERTSNRERETGQADKN